eukprot:PRCOL_00001615-RA
MALVVPPWDARVLAGDAPAEVARAFEAASVAPYRGRPARQQRASGPMRSANRDAEINLWHGGRIGDHARRGRNAPRIAVDTRVDVAVDSGDTLASEGSATASICTYFAGGCCSAGARCSFLHRLPLGADERRLGNGVDCFGRNRHATQRHDMGGVGCVLFPNRSLYVNYEGTFKAGGRTARPTPAEAVKAIALDNFKEFGPVAGIHVVPTKCLLFVRYHWRCSAEFALEALSGRRLMGAAVPADADPLVIKWAHEDPNPMSKRREEGIVREAVAAARSKRAADMPPEALRAIQMRRLATEHGVYPDTSAQFAAALGSVEGPQRPAGAVSFDPDEYEDVCCEVTRVEEGGPSPKSAEALTLLGAYGSDSDSESA